MEVKETSLSPIFQKESLIRRTNGWLRATAAVVSDRTHGASVSCSATIRSVPAAVLELSTPQSPVSSAGDFSYTLAYHKGTTSAVSNVQLSLPVPVGASFVSADGGGGSTDGVVRWTLSSVPAGASGEVNVTLKAPTTTLAVSGGSGAA